MPAAIFITPPAAAPAGPPTTITMDGDGGTFTTGDDYSPTWSVDGGSDAATLYYDGVSQGSGASGGVAITGLAAGDHDLYVVASGGAMPTSPTISITVADPVGNSATFIGYDNTTQGTWSGVYGGDGYVMATGGSTPEADATYALKPAYASFSSSGSTYFAWADPSVDLRGLQSPDGSHRIAATWYAGTSETFTLTLSGGTHSLGLYMLDMDGGRGASVAFYDADTAALLDTQYIDTATPFASAYAFGTWLRWAVSGHVTIVITRYGGVNGTVSGFFFDP